MKISEAATGVGEEMADVGLAMQRAVDKTENMRARAGAMEELEAAGAFDDNLALGSGEDDIDRQLARADLAGQVDDELAKMKAELGTGERARRRPALEPGQGGRRVIVRISTENQYRFPDDRPTASTSSTTRPSRRSRPATRTRFHEAFEEMLDARARRGHAARRRRARGAPT